ncbi:hypothetical protein M6B22_11145 [Jatrophihabitans cynanchi]|uniref:Helix-turn-helix domain-containing protein n=1 Tax=Jatrophihabitans cynanchi TaxID=2944128 RepID=A0ABY7JW31_9ACTN|nr:hypothetical protein [Jatrophihabitans sp. SB3-54]WAX55116.1 hypothetical protein M6B22_11145 [Jatrophihabitans sp. SB3-54]
MRTMASTPVAAEIGRSAVERIQIMRAKGRCAAQIADGLGLDVYVVDEVFAWHDWLCEWKKSEGGMVATRPLH